MKGVSMCDVCEHVRCVWCDDCNEYYNIIPYIYTYVNVGGMRGMKISSQKV